MRTPVIRREARIVISREGEQVASEQETTTTEWELVRDTMDNVDAIRAGLKAVGFTQDERAVWYPRKPGRWLERWERKALYSDGGHEDHERAVLVVGGETLTISVEYREVNETDGGWERCEP